MAQYNDMSQYVCPYGEDNILNIGWLGNKPFNKGFVSKEFILCLWEYIKYPVIVGRTIYTNNYLDHKSDSYTACYNGYQILLGASEIRVMNPKKNLVYASPNLILHYIMNHDYLPPNEFIEAVMYGPKTNSEEYQRMIVTTHKNRNVSRQSSLSCPYCGGSRNYFAPSKKKRYELDTDIRVVNTSLVNENSYNHNDYELNVICEMCGKMFCVSYDDIMAN